MDIESRPRLVTLIIAGLIVTCLLRILPTSISPANVSFGVPDYEPRDSATQFNSVEWWSMFRHDVQHTGYSASIAPETNSTLWDSQVGAYGYVVSSPAVVDDRVFVGCYDGNLYCLHADSGSEIWRHETIGIVRSSPAVADGRVFIGGQWYSVWGAIFALNAETGAVEWFANLTRGSVWSSPVVADGRVYIGSQYYVGPNNYGKIDCFDVSTGIKMWCEVRDGPIESSPAVADGKVYVGSNDGKVYCLDAATGTELWKRPTGGSVRSSPAVVDGKVYVGSDDSDIYCLDAESGAILWATPTSGIVESSPAVADGRVYVGSDDAMIYCLDAASGTVIWSVPTGGSVRSSPAVAEGKVYVGSNDGKVYCQDVATGADVWNYTTGGSVRSSPAVAEGKVYVGSNDGKVYAFQDAIVFKHSVVNFDGRLLDNYMIDDRPPKIRTRIFDGTMWRPQPIPLPEPRTAPYSPDTAINPEPLPPKLVMSSEINPEPLPGSIEPNIMMREFNGSEWSGPTAAPSFTAMGVNPSMAYCPLWGSRGMYLFWEDRATTPPTIRCTSEATYWSNFTILGEGEQPTSIFYNDFLFVIFMKNDTLAYRTYDGFSWSDDNPWGLMEPQPTPHDPFITVHNGQLHVVYESQSLYLHTLNGTIWSGPYALENYGALSPSDPAIASFNNQLHILYVSDGDLYHQILDGDLGTGEWLPPAPVPTQPLDTEWWPMFHHDLNNTGYSSSTAPSTDNILWDYTTGEGVLSSPAVCDGRVYIGSYDDKVYCLDATTGTKIWNYPTGYDVTFSSPAVADGKVYVGSGLKIYCLDALTGVHIWNYTTGAGVPSSPAVSDGRVYIGSIDNEIYCLNASTGKLVWNYTTGGDVYSSPAVADGRVYVGSDDSRIYCLNATSGDQLWNFTSGHSVRSSPSVADGRVYVGSADNKIYCLNAYTGANIWSYITGERVLYSCPAVFDGKVYVGSEDHKIYCLNATTGVRFWDFKTGGMIWSSPAVADDKVYVGSHDNKVYCLDASTGFHIWDYTTGNSVHSSPAVAAGTVFIGSHDNKVYAFGPTNIHDVAITQVTPSKTVVCQDHSMHISVTVENHGPYAGSFKATAYYLNLSIETTTIINLGSEQETTITFTWNTTGLDKGNYTLSALAHQVPGEKSINDNYFTDGWVIVAMIGDITGPDGPPDGKCDMRDIGLVARNFGQNVPPAPANCDLTGPTTGVPDGKIDMRDIGLVARHFGETDP